MDQSQIPEPTELVYVPAPSWGPAFTAVGLAAVAIGAFAGWVISLAGGIALIAAGVNWYRDYVDQTQRLPRRQRVTSAVIPPATLREERRAKP
jgi:hypothetical protein